ncbi:trypsin-like peptidase domain-containing protein [Phormidium pseudopriestleyi FRX01]|uniref:Trypsin-like peptidase domain-containing protein n=1 Tax=Phormidium pseudopriestleyi FRX01 TaxID=1759528 RepID=A0ABS3FV53_9CYAN|nr:serine protease [Phormidium pseudopriestleyi]MBO0351004.1 trypsin-like peptidase domain-containing protein [Phormidium pseudopriestleyi FRX01]
MLPGILLIILAHDAIAPIISYGQSGDAVSTFKTVYSDRLDARGILSVAPNLKGPMEDASASEIARLVTVRILTQNGSGSGAIVARRGPTYTVLTNNHVVIDTPENGYRLITADGEYHAAWWMPLPQFGNLDLALVQFTSSNSYRVAEIADSNALSVGDPVYAAGFPAWHFNQEGDRLVSIEDTRDWGVSAFRVTLGQVQMRSPRSLQGGYQIGYTNDVLLGMSGGPVVDRNGALIGINGKLKYPFQGINAFIFADGSVPSPQLFEQMEALSWAIPIAQFQQNTIPLNEESQGGL